MQAYAELILFSCLPKTLVDNFMNLPEAAELKSMFSYIFTADDCLETG